MHPNEIKLTPEVINELSLTIMEKLTGKHTLAMIEQHGRQQKESETT